MGISFVTALLAVPAIALGAPAIINEAVNETKLSFKKQDQFKCMFDCLQDGIVVFKNDTIYFMNELSSKILGEITQLKSF